MLPSKVPAVSVRACFSVIAKYWGTPLGVNDPGIVLDSYFATNIPSNLDIWTEYVEMIALRSTYKTQPIDNIMWRSNIFMILVKYRILNISSEDLTAYFWKNILYKDVTFKAESTLKNNNYIFNFSRFSSHVLYTYYLIYKTVQNFLYL